MSADRVSESVRAPAKNAWVAPCARLLGTAAAAQTGGASMDMDGGSGMGNMGSHP